MVHGRIGGLRRRSRVFPLLPRSGDASSLAMSQSLALAVGMVALIVFAQANAPQWPRGRDLV